VTLDTTAGSEQVPATLVRTALGLRSTWVTMGVLRLDRPSRGAVVFGSSTHLSGVGRGLGTPRLASSPDGAAWTTVVTVAPDTAGELAFDVSPTRTTRYRLEAEGRDINPVVQVAPRLRSRPTALAPGVLTGKSSPKLPGARSRSSGRRARLGARRRPWPTRRAPSVGSTLPCRQGYRARGAPQASSWACHRPCRSSHEACAGRGRRSGRLAALRPPQARRAWPSGSWADIQQSRQQPRGASKPEAHPARGRPAGQRFAPQFVVSVRQALVRRLARTPSDARPKQWCLPPTTRRG
jgi:hypothetical protein